MWEVTPCPLVNPHCFVFTTGLLGLHTSWDHMTEKTWDTRKVQTEAPVAVSAREKRHRSECRSPISPLAVLQALLNSIAIFKVSPLMYMGCESGWGPTPDLTVLHLTRIVGFFSHTYCWAVNFLPVNTRTAKKENGCVTSENICISLILRTAIKINTERN